MTEPVRVASIARLLHIAGDENRLLQTALAFDPSEVEQVVMIVDRPGDMTERERGRWADMVAAYRSNGTELLDLSAPHRSGRLRAVVDRAALVRRLAKEFRRRRIDVVDARMGLPLTLALPAARAAGVPVVTLTAYYASNFDLPVRYFVGQACMLGVDALISDARATLDDFDRWRWSRRSELVLIHNGIQPALSPLDRANARAELGLPTDPDVTVIGQVSRVMPRKNFEIFIRAAARVLDTQPDVHFAAVGFVSEPERQHFESLVRLRNQLGIAERLHFLSHPGPVGEVYRALDVFAHLSHTDSSPIAIHEAMSAGVPSVISAIPGNLELVDDGGSGLLVPPNDIEATADAFLRLVKDPELARRLSEGALRRYDERHRPEHMAGAHLELYRRLLGRRR